MAQPSLSRASHRFRQVLRISARVDSRRVFRKERFHTASRIEDHQSARGSLPENYICMRDIGSSHEGITGLEDGSIRATLHPDSSGEHEEELVLVKRMCSAGPFPGGVWTLTAAYVLPISAPGHLR